MITDVAIDLDGTIYPFADTFKAYCLERMGIDDLPTPTHWNFYEDWGMDSETFTAWLRDAALSHRVFATAEPYEGVVEAWKDLRDMGVHIHVMTARLQSAWAQTAEWLADHKLHADSLHFGTSKKYIAQLAKDQVMMLDDHVFYYEEAERNGVIPVLIDRPWNQHKQDATRVDSLPAFVSLLRGYNLSTKAKLHTVKNDKKNYPWKPEKLPNYHEYVKEPEDFPTRVKRIYSGQ